MLKMEVTVDGREPFTVTVATRDVAVWERKHKGATLHQLQTNPSMIALYQVAHAACARQGLFDGTLAEFETGADLEMLEDEAVDPTTPAA